VTTTKFQKLFIVTTTEFQIRVPWPPQSFKKSCIVATTKFWPPQSFKKSCTVTTTEFQKIVYRYHHEVSEIVYRDHHRVSKNRVPWPPQNLKNSCIVATTNFKKLCIMTTTEFQKIVYRDWKLHFRSTRSDRCLKPFDVLKTWQLRRYFLKMEKKRAEIRLSFSQTAWIGVCNIVH